MEWIKKILRKVVQTLKVVVVKGFSPHKLAIAIVLGLSVGIIPFLGVTTLFLIGVAFVFRLNVAVIQVFNYIVYPIQWVVYVPFLKLGSLLSGNPALELNFHQIRQAFAESWFQAFSTMWQIHLWGIVVWFICITPIALVIYYQVYRLLKDYQEGRKNSLLNKLRSLNRLISVKKA